MPGASTPDRDRRPWTTFLAAFAFLYLTIAMVFLLGGAGAAEAWGTPAAILLGPALGVAVVRYRKTR